ncbi:hypothetical protein NEUTE2DRAFT_74194, partial [Neurospora tetrasperma FGSC 2509]
EVNKVNLYCPSINYTIEIKRNKNGREIPLPYSLFYNIFSEAFLVLKKTLKNLFDKGFIRASNSLIVVPVLFVWKLSGNLRFYYNY